MPTDPMRMAVLQSNYVPWKGYFDLIAAVDHFVFYDDAQYTSRDWRNRNRIKSPQGAQWLSIPVHAAGRPRIRDVAICDPACGQAHWKRLLACYGRARHADAIAAWLQPLYCQADWHMLSTVNRRLIEAICGVLGIGTRLGDSSEYGSSDDGWSDYGSSAHGSSEHDSSGGPSARLLAMCRQAGADTYVSGPAAQAYLDVGAFTRAGVQVEWFDYAGYPPYPQLWGGPFVHELSILDLLFNCGPDAPRHMKLAATAAAA